MKFNENTPLTYNPFLAQKMRTSLMRNWKNMTGRPFSFLAKIGKNNENSVELENLRTHARKFGYSLWLRGRNKDRQSLYKVDKGYRRDVRKDEAEYFAIYLRHSKTGSTIPIIDQLNFEKYLIRLVRNMK